MSCRLALVLTAACLPMAARAKGHEIFEEPAVAEQVALLVKE